MKEILTIGFTVILVIGIILAFFKDNSITDSSFGWGLVLLVIGLLGLIGSI